MPELNVACSGLAVNSKKEDWLALASDNANLKYALEKLYDLFKEAPLLGSLINPEIGLGKGTLFEIEWDEVAPLLTEALVCEPDDEKWEIGVVAQGIAKAASLLSSKYHLVATNVPYLTRYKQTDILRDFSQENYADGKNDLSTVFLDRCLESCCEGGTSSVVLPQNWLFLPGYKKIRERLLRKDVLHVIARLGTGAFDSISGEVVQAILLIVSLGKEVDEKPDSAGSNTIICLDLSQSGDSLEKSRKLRDSQPVFVSQKSLLRGQHIIELSETEKKSIIGDFGRAWQGLVGGDDARFLMRIWEFPSKGTVWKEIQRAPQFMDAYTGRDSYIRWEEGKGVLHKASKAHNFPPASVLGKSGVALQIVGQLSATLYSGDVFNGAVAALIPFNSQDLPALWSFASSPEFLPAVRKTNQKVQVNPGAFSEVEIDIQHWRNIAKEKYPYGLPKPFSTDPTQWVFHGHPAKSDAPLQVGVARLLGYRWPAELDSTMELSDEAHFWVEKSKQLLSCSDEDGIVCIPSVRGEKKAEDRLETLLVAAFGNDWTINKKSELLTKADHADKTLESWLREKFFTQHCELFHDRPFIWHIWDGLSDGFAALINYHKLDAKLLETLIYTYLGDWISRQKQEKANGRDGAEEKLAAAEGLKKRLELILEGEKPYDIFVRWKPIDNQPIGWNPDLNDGLRFNIRPFLSVSEVGKKGAGVLRDRPNINWGKDKGKDVESAPWFKLGTRYGGREGDRVCDHHLSLAEKHVARKNSIKSNSGGNCK